MGSLDSWAERAALWDVEPSYFDVHGVVHHASDETLQKVVDALSRHGLAPAHSSPPPQPRFAYQGDGRRTWVLAVQLYSVRSRRNWGHGDFTDLAMLLELAARIGCGGIGLNPLHALFYDRGDRSPYAPNSRLFFNPLYIDVEAIEEFERSDVKGFEKEIERLRLGPLVDYPAVSALKIRALRAAYGAFRNRATAERRHDFDRYRSERGQSLVRFAAFETLRNLHDGPWRHWPENCRTPSDSLISRLRDEHEEQTTFHEFMQWSAERQLQTCRAIAEQRKLSIGLYLDTAVGMNPDGADAWLDQDAVLHGLSVGAPPDQFNPAGQDWGITAYDPHRLAEAGFEPFRQMIRAAMRHAGAIRIDHVMGLMRLFVVPHGLTGRDGAYLRMPFERMLEVVVEESNRWACIVVGEDLGTVPEGFRPAIAAWGLWSYLVMMFERNWDGSYRPPSAYREMAVATVNTHDLATFAGWIDGHDLDLKHKLGIDPGESPDEREGARCALRAAVQAMNSKQGVTFENVAAFLAATPTRLVSVAIEDVLELRDQVNVPGIVDQHPNWQRRLPVLIEQLADDRRLRTIAATMTRAGRGLVSD